MTADRVSLEAWSALWRRLGARSDPTPAHGEIHRAYSEPHRHYHTLEHIAHALGRLDGIRSRVGAPDAAELALWLHDFVYDPRAKDNEARSAAYARRLLAEGGLVPVVGEQVTDLIMATCHASPPEAPDARYVVDTDLSILGASAAEFDRYERQVRQEYAFVSEPDWRAGRARILRVFLDRPRIFLTPEFAALEGPARANLERSIEALQRAP
jgi:predicted metal-dependent HD superfamily phosphohydrolase